MARPAATTREERILVVDDESGMRELLSALFGKNGYPTIAAADATTGYNLAVEANPAVVIVDYRLAGGGGINLIRKIREKLPGAKCVFMTAHESPELFEQALEAGAHDTIRKPFDILALLAKVERLLGPADRPASGTGPRLGSQVETSHG